MSVFSFARRRLLQVAAAVSLIGALAACGDTPPPFKGSDITGTRLGKNMALTDMNGQPRTLADFAGKVAVVFFGFTQCPDVCPTSLAEMAEVMQTLGPDADRVQVLLVTVDPERDSPEVLKEYVGSFDPRFLALSGTAEQTKQAAGAFKAYYAKVPTKDGGYTMDHTAAFYLIDGKGESRVLANSTLGAQALAHDIKLLLDEK